MELSFGALKPKVLGFVAKGMENISTPVMRATIARAFAEDGQLFYLRKNMDKFLTTQVEEKVQIPFEVVEVIYDLVYNLNIHSLQV